MLMMHRLQNHFMWKRQITNARVVIDPRQQRHDFVAFQALLHNVCQLTHTHIHIYKFLSGCKEV